MLNKPANALHRVRNNSFHSEQLGSCGMLFACRYHVVLFRPSKNKCENKCCLFCEVSSIYVIGEILFTFESLSNISKTTIRNVFMSAFCLVNAIYISYVADFFFLMKRINHFVHSKIL